MCIDPPEVAKPPRPPWADIKYRITPCAEARLCSFPCFFKGSLDIIALCCPQTLYYSQELCSLGSLVCWASDTRKHVGPRGLTAAPLFSTQSVIVVRRPVPATEAVVPGIKILGQQYRTEMAPSIKHFADKPPLKGRGHPILDSHHGERVSLASQSLVVLQL